MESVRKLDYPNFEIIIVDDGSTDSTRRIIRRYIKEGIVRGVFKEKNQGKPAALNDGFLVSQGKIILAIDADCEVESDILKWLVPHFIKMPRLGAITGNPRVKNRTSLLAKIQTAEYSSIIGLIKRSQRVLDKILTVSGVVAIYRREALIDIKLWDSDIVTEDINLTWKLEKRAWQVWYEPHAICWVFVPEKLNNLWHQRVRWAQGGIQVMRRHKDIWKSWRYRRLWPIYIDYLLSVLWSFDFVILSTLWLVSKIFKLNLLGASPIPEWWGALLALLCLFQFMVAILIDRKYDSTLTRYYFWVAWYPLFYWIFNALAVVRATPLALKPMKEFATWKSPDRGLHFSD